MKVFSWNNHLMLYLWLCYTYVYILWHENVVWTFIVTILWKKIHDAVESKYFHRFAVLPPLLMGGGISGLLIVNYFSYLDIYSIVIILIMFGYIFYCYYTCHVWVYMLKINNTTHQIWHPYLIHCSCIWIDVFHSSYNENVFIHPCCINE